MTSRRYATFAIADQLFGVEVTAVREVLAAADYTAVPLAPPAVAGLFHRRGQVVAAVDLAERLGLRRGGRAGPAMNVILSGGPGAVSLLVDRIGDVVEVRDDAVKPPPDTLAEPARRLVTGTVTLDDQLMLVLAPTAAAGPDGLVG